MRFRWIAALFLSTFSFPHISDGATCFTPPGGLIGWWSGEGSAADVLGANNGSLVGAATAIAPGVVGTAFAFDGTNAFVQIPNSALLRPTNFTIEAWVRFSALDSAGSGGSPAGDQYIVFRQNSRSSDFEGFDLSKTRVAGSDVFRFLISSATAQSIELHSSTIISTGVWYHVAAVRGPDFVQLLVNGNIERQSNVFFPQDYGNFPLYFGTSGQAFWDHKFKGNLDEVSIYDHALSTNELFAIYTAGSAGKCKAPGIATQPQDQTVALGGSALFLTSATGLGPLTYQWRLNGTNIAGATASILSLKNIQLAQQGAYSVRVSNVAGTAISSSAVLTVLTPPSGVPAITSFAPVSTNPGSSVVISGTNFDPANNIVYFGAVRANITSGSSTSLTATVPFGATYAPITVAANGFVAASKVPFQPTFIGDGSPISASTFAPRQDLIGADGPFVTVIADLDGDGKPDLAIGNVYGHSVSFFRNLGSPGSLSASSFSSRIDLPSFGGPSDNPIAFVGADVDGDGKIDLIYADRSLNRLGIYRNVSTPGTLNTNSFAAPLFFNTGADPRGIAVQDLDGDGRPDIVTANYGDGTVSILRNVSAGSLDSNSFAPRVDIPSGAGAYKVTIQDLDGDGRPDLAVINANTSTLTLLRNLSAPRALDANSFAERWDLPALGNNITLIAGDVDADGRPDLLAGGTSDFFSFYRNISAPGTLSNSFAPNIDFGNPGWVHNVVLGDLNGDGRADVSVVGELGSFFSLFQNQSQNGSFSLAYAAGFSTGWNPWGISIGDLDGDGRPDAVFCNVYDDTITLYRNVTPFGGPPTISIQPTNATVGLGGTAIFSAAAIGQIPLGFSWRFNGTNMVPSTRVTGTNASTLIITHLQPSDAGNYTVVVTNSLGSVTSSVALLNVVTPPPCASPGSDIVGWWKAENSTVDITSGSAGTVAGFGTFGYAPGVVGQAFVFDGIHRDRVDLGNPANLQLQNFTIEAWIKRSDPTDISLDDLNQDGAIAGEGGLVLSYGRLGYGFGLVNSGQLILSRIDLDGVYSSAAVTDTNWHHVAVTKSGAKAIFYVDGLPASGNITYNTTYTFGTSISIGSRGDAYGGTFFGLIDEPAIYKRALSASEILNLYNAGATGKCPLPPVIVSSPTNQTVVGGFNFSLNVQAAGVAPLAYQWFLNGSALSNGGRISGADTTNLSIANAQVDDSGNYFVAVSNIGGFTTSSVAVVTIQLVAPSFTQQPQNQAGPVGTNALFSVMTTGSIPISYQWFFNSNSLSDGGRISGSATASLTISNCQTNDNGNYYVVASNSAGLSTSAVASLFVGLPPSITQSPLSQTNLAGSNLTFTVAVAGTAPLGYAWRFNGNKLSDNARISGSATSSLAISNLLTSDAGNYDVIVTNGVGSVTSAVAVLTIVQAPTITLQPISRCSAIGMSNVFTSTASGTAPISLQWQRNGTNIPNATSTLVQISNTSLADFGTYHLVASNAYGVATSADALLAQGPIAVWGSSSSITPIPVSATNAIMVSAGNNGPVAGSHVLALKSDGSVLGWGANSFGQATPPPSATNIVAIAAGGNHSLALRADGKVIAWGSNSSGQTNVPATLSNVVAVAAGTSHSLALRADGKVVAWGLNSSGQTNVPSSLTRVIAIAAGNAHSLAIRSDGTLAAWGSNFNERQGSPGPSYVPPGLTGIIAIAGGAHTVIVRSNGTALAWGSYNSDITNVPPSATNLVGVAASDYYTLARRSNGSVLAWGYTSPAGAPTGVLNVPPAVSNAVGLSAGYSQAFALLNDGRPMIIRQPVGGTTFVGRDFTFSPVAVGAGRLSYQWQANGVDIADATNATLALSNLSLANAANYRLVVSNALGVATSISVPLTVLDQPHLVVDVLSQPPLFQTNYQGARVTLSINFLGNGPLSYQWKFNGNNLPYGTNQDLVFDPILVSNDGNYSVVVSNSIETISSSIVYSQRVVLVKAFGFLSNEPPINLTNAVALAVGYSGQGSSFGPYFALRSDRKLVGWGVSQFGTTNPPPSVTNSTITAIAAGFDDALALRSDGTVAAWGNYIYGQTNVPASVNNITAIACGDYHNVALKSDGTVAVWGQGTFQQTNVPPSATNIVAISGGGQHTLALRADGTVVSWASSLGNLNVIPPNATNVIAVAAGYAHNLVLRADGTVVQWGGLSVKLPDIPAGLSNVVAIAAGYSHSLALRSDGTVIPWGNYYPSQPILIPTDVANVAQIACRGDHDLALLGTRAPAATVQPFDRTLFRGSNTIIAAKFSGAQPVAFQWQWNGTNIAGATNDVLALTNLQFSQAGAYQLIASNSYGLGASRLAKLSVTLPLPEALDTAFVPWTTTGSARWFGQTNVSHDGVDSAQSGSIGPNQESVLQATLEGPAQFSFWWKVSSEASFDFAEFKLDGVSQASISGEVDWQQQSYSLSSGSHTLVWRYAKDASGSAGQDAVWVDQVLYVPNLPVITQQPQPLSVTTNGGATVQFIAAASGPGPLIYQWRQNETNNVGPNSPTLILPGVTRSNGGLYSVRVFNAGGGVISSNAQLRVLVPQHFTGNPIIVNGTVLFFSTDADGGLLTSNDLSGFTAQFSSNLLDWVTLPNSLSISNGMLLLRDLDQANHAVRFYRILEQ